MNTSPPPVLPFAKRAGPFLFSFSPPFCGDCDSPPSLPQLLLLNFVYVGCTVGPQNPFFFLFFFFSLKGARGGSFLFLLLNHNDELCRLSFSPIYLGFSSLFSPPCPIGPRFLFFFFPKKNFRLFPSLLFPAKSVLCFFFSCWKNDGDASPPARGPLFDPSFSVFPSFFAERLDWNLSLSLFGLVFSPPGYRGSSTHDDFFLLRVKSTDFPLPSVAMSSPFFLSLFVYKQTLFSQVLSVFSRVPPSFLRSRLSFSSIFFFGFFCMGISFFLLGESEIFMNLDPIFFPFFFLFVYGDQKAGLFLLMQRVILFSFLPRYLLSLL